MTSKKTRAKEKKTAVHAKVSTAAKGARTGGQKTVSRPASRKASSKPAAAKSGAASAQGLSAERKRELREMLLSMRERLLNQVSALTNDSLVRDRDDVNTAEDGTDFFERQFALNIASSEQEAILDIDEALRRLDEGRYGVCEDCGQLIELPRLKALPFVRKCVRCQAQSENGRLKFRPLVGPPEEI